MNIFASQSFRRNAQLAAYGAFRFLASLNLAVVLILLFAATLALGTVLETRYGLAHAHWYVYKSTWFLGLLTLFALNIFCAAAIRFPWKKHQTGFVITHIGLLLLLGGSLQSFLRGIEGRISLAEGETTNSIVDSFRDQITASWVEKPNEPSYEFTFAAGPVDWPEGKQLALGEVDGVSATILSYFQHAKVAQKHTADATKTSGPTLEFQLKGPDGKMIVESWLTDEGIGDEVSAGPIRLQLQRAVNQQMQEDFLHPPSGEEIGSHGLLLMYYGAHTGRMAVDDAIAKTFTIGDSGISVEIDHYFPNARPDALGQFTTLGDEPKNPLLELRVHLPGQSSPLRQIAFAKNPMLTLDGVYQRTCPVKFRYLHPSVMPSTGIEFLRGVNGDLLYRVLAEGLQVAQGEAAIGKSIALPGKFQCVLTTLLPYARRDVYFEPAHSTSQAKLAPESAVLVELRIGDASHQVWLRRDDMASDRIISTNEGSLRVHYGAARKALGYALKLVDFQHEVNPGRIGNSSYSSLVELVYKKSDLPQRYEIFMNQPLTAGRFRIYQSSFDESQPDHPTSIFNVAYDPGRVLKYCGGLTICFGIAIMFYMRAYFSSAWDGFAGPPTHEEAIQE